MPDHTTKAQDTALVQETMRKVINGTLGNSVPLSDQSSTESVIKACEVLLTTHRGES